MRKHDASAALAFTSPARRRFCLIAASTAGTALSPLAAYAKNADKGAIAPSRHTDSGNALLVAAVGNTLHAFRVDASRANLQQAERAFTVPASVQYAWQHPTMPLLYVAFSNGSPTSAGDRHGIATVHFQADGTMSEAFPAVALDNRPINISASLDGRFLLIAYNAPSGVSVHSLSPHGAPGSAIAQQSPIDAGVYAHQVRTTPDGDSVLLVTRGNDAKPGKPEDPGAIKQFRFSDGQLRDERSIAPNGGFGFGPRHLDFHPTKPWVYVSLERQNQLMMFTLRDGQLADTPTFTITTVRDPAHEHPRQMVAAVHVSQDGRFVYVSNRADGTVTQGGHAIFAGGENSITAFAIDQASGAPRLLQSVDTDNFNPRTFAIDPSGEMLVAAAIEPMPVAENSDSNTPSIRDIPASLTTFRIAADGRMERTGVRDIETDGKWMFWSAMVRFG